MIITGSLFEACSSVMDSPAGPLVDGHRFAQGNFLKAFKTSRGLPKQCLLKRKIPQRLPAQNAIGFTDRLSGRIVVYTETGDLNLDFQVPATGGRSLIVRW